MTGVTARSGVGSEVPVSRSATDHSDAARSAPRVVLGKRLVSHRLGVHRIAR
jgi:hypothetical protein